MAALACHKANFESLELALEFIYGRDPQNLHNHPFVPFQVNERELILTQKTLANETNGMNTYNLMLEKSPGVSPAPSHAAEPISNQENYVTPIEETGELASILKVRCFICKGRRETHLDEGRRQLDNERAERLLMSRGG